MKNISKKSEIRQPIIRAWPGPSNINHNGHIFGGWILSQMDIAGGILSSRTSGGLVATVAVEAMKFYQPVLVSDWLSVYADITNIGRTSITVNIEVAVLRRDEDQEIKVTEGTFVFVHVDDDGKPREIDAEHRRKFEENQK